MLEGSGGESRQETLLGFAGSLAASPGALGGNRFLLRLRGVRVSARRVRAAVRRSP